MKILLSTLLLLVTGSFSPIFAESPFRAGEELVYTVKWTGVPAGEIRMKTHRHGKDELRFELKAQTNGFWSMVHKVRDTIVSKVRESDFASLSYYKDSRQGRRHIEQSCSMEYAQSQVVRSRQNHSAKEQAKIDKFEIPEGVSSLKDPLSMIYFLRLFSYQNPEELKDTFHVFASKGVYGINFKHKAEVSFDSSIFGNRRAWNMEPSAEYEGSLVSKGRLELWVDCETGIPLRLMFHIPVGWATLELKTSNHPDLLSTSFRQRRRR